VRVQGPSEMDDAKTAAARVLAEIDHRALGVDVNLGVDPTLGELARWIGERLDAYGVIEVRLVSGDGCGARYCAQPSSEAGAPPPVSVSG
jgi:hypothetical protein